MKKEKIRILLVDEDQHDYRITREHLLQIPRKSISLQWVSDYDRAYELLCQKPFDICLVEYRMRHRTGLNFLKKVKKNNCTVPLIILTRTKTHMADVLTMRHGAADYLIKDHMTPSLLERSIRYTLERQKTEAERLKLLREQTRRIEAEIAQKRVTLLSDASKILASTLEYRRSLREIAKLLVPHLADWCIIDVLDNERFERLVVLHKDPKKKKIADTIEKEFPPDLLSPGGVGKVLRTGEKEAFSTLRKTDLKKTTRNDPRLLRLVQELGLASYLIVPIMSRERILGAIALAYGDSQRQYSLFDESLVSELTQRIALAIDNAMLYEKSLEGISIRDEFLNAASHELKTPLTSLQLQMQLLSRSLLDETTEQKERVRELLSANIRQIHRLTKLINNLLDVSRIEAKIIDLELEEVDLTQVITEVVDRFSSEARSYGSTIRLETNGPVTGRFDRFRLDEVATNLLSNALKYGEGNPIHVTVKRDGDQGMLIVRDAGMGIRPEERKKIFHRFERTAMTRNLGGLGLGLYIVSRIVSAHGGSITVESTVHKGSTFTVSLPLKPKNALH